MSSTFSSVMKISSILHFFRRTKLFFVKPNGLLYETFSVFCPVDRLDCLGLVESEDILLDWTQPISLNFTHSDIIDRIEKFYDTRGTVEKVAGDIYVCEEPKDPDITELSEEWEVKELEKEHAQAIHDLYPANDMEAVEVFERLITALPAYGVFCSGDLAAWMVQSYYGAMFSMQTRPEFRRKGFGLRLASTLTKTVRSRGYIPFVVIRPENDASQSLYTKLGFVKSYQTIRAVLRPHRPKLLA